MATSASENILASDIQMNPIHKPWLQLPQGAAGLRWWDQKLGNLIKLRQQGSSRSGFFALNTLDITRRNSHIEKHVKSCATVVMIFSLFGSVACQSSQRSSQATETAPHALPFDMLSFHTGERTDDRPFMTQLKDRFTYSGSPIRLMMWELPANGTPVYYVPTLPELAMGRRLHALSRY